MINSVFHDVVDVLRLLLAATLMVFLGKGIRKFFCFESKSVLQESVDLLLGQTLVCFYFIVRSSFLQNFPIKNIELILLCLVASFCLVRSSTKFEFKSIFGWVVPLLPLIYLKIGLPYNLSSDPDIHAFHAKLFAESGRVAQFVWNDSSVPLNYPGGFATINVVWMLLSGLNSVQIVNVQPFLQLAIFAGVAIWLVGRLRKSELGFTKIFVISYLYLWTFSVLMIPGREYYEGTARLSHTAIILGPIVFAKLVGDFGLRQLGILKQVCFFVLFSFSLIQNTLINPAHIPLLFLVYLIFFGEQIYSFYKESKGTIIANRSLNRNSIALLFLSLIVVFYFFVTRDTYFGPALRNYGVKNIETSNVSQRSLILVEKFELTEYFTQLVEQVKGLFLIEHWKPEILASCILFFVFGIFFTKARHGLIAYFVLTSLAMVSVNSSAIALLQSIRNEKSLSAYLLAVYSSAYLTQFLLLFLASLAAIIIADFRVKKKTVIILVFLLGVFYQGRKNFRKFFRLDAPAGHVTETDFQAIRWLETYLKGKNETRVALTGLLFDTGKEYWVFPSNGARVLPLYTNIKTAFFYGIDGVDFKAENYERHVYHRVDVPWLCSKNVGYIFDSGKHVIRFSSELEGLSILKDFNSTQIYKLKCDGKKFHK